MRLTPEAAAALHLAKAREYWREDRLAEAQAALGRTMNAGLAVGHIYDFVRVLEAEAAARLSGSILRVAEHLQVETSAPSAELRVLAASSIEAQRTVETRLRIRWGSPILVTLLPSEPWVAWMRSNAGYYAARTERHKVCLPAGSVANPTDLARALRHEFAHAAVHQLAGERVPRWLNEGIAVMLEGGMPSRERKQWAKVKAEGAPTINQIEAAFTTYHQQPGLEQLHLAYSAAEDLVASIVARWGEEKLRDLLVNIGRGQSWDAACRRVLGLRAGRFERDWRARGAMASCP